MSFYALFIRLEARSDLFEIYEYLAERASREFAVRYIERIETACERLTAFPFQGRAREELGGNLRSFSFEGRVVIIYSVLEKTVEIVRVFHAGRDYGPEAFPH